MDQGMPFFRIFSYPQDVNKIFFLVNLLSLISSLNQTTNQ